MPPAIVELLAAGLHLRDVGQPRPGLDGATGCNMVLHCAEQPVASKVHLRDNDGKFVKEFDDILRDEGVKVIRIAPRLPSGSCRQSRASACPTPRTLQPGGRSRHRRCKHVKRSPCCASLP
jgi:hypothetical protein